MLTFLLPLLATRAEKVPALPGEQPMQGAASIGTTHLVPQGTTKGDNIFSPEYVYNQIKISTCASGAYVTSGLNLLKSQGVCTWSSMPYTDVSCNTMPNDAQKTEAAGFKITSYGRVTINASTIKSYLASNKPVIVAGPVNNNFVNLKNGQVLGKFIGKSLGGHCYCLVGYDDAKNAFKFQNSWGNWASQGFGWISYNYIKSWWQEAYVITTTPAAY